MNKNDHLAFATRLAREAGARLQEQQRSGDWEARLKSDRTVVTSADLMADRLILSAIQASYPQDLVLTEEREPVLPSGWQNFAGGLWIVDPLDGTTNFSLGLPIWGVLIARLVGGVPETAVAYFPMLDEMYTAYRGAGAWLNDRLLIVPGEDARRPLSFFACCSRTHRGYQVNVPYKTRILGSAGYTLCAVARGMAILGFETVTRLWDLAAPWLVLSEAGGTAFAVEGAQPFPLTAEVNAGQSFTVMAAANGEIAEKGRGWITRREEG